MNTPVSAHPAAQGNPVIRKIHAASGKITTLPGTSSARTVEMEVLQCLPNSRTLDRSGDIAMDKGNSIFGAVVQ